MSVHQCRIEIRQDRVSSIDEILAEWGDSRWMVIEELATSRAWLAGFFAASRFDLNLRPVLNDCMKGLPMNTNGQGQKTAKIKLEKKEPGCSRDLTRY